MIITNPTIVFHVVKHVVIHEERCSTEVASALPTQPIDVAEIYHQLHCLESGQCKKLNSWSNPSRTSLLQASTTKNSYSNLTWAPDSFLVRWYGNPKDLRWKGWKKKNLNLEDQKQKTKRRITKK